MGDLFTVADKGIGIILKIRGALAKVKGNKEDCRRISETLDAVSTITASLQGAPMMEDKGISLAMSHLKDVLESTQTEIDKCLRTKNKALHAMKAGDIAEKLNKAHQDLTQKMMLVVFALLAKCFRPADPPSLPPGYEIQMVRWVQPSSASNSTNDAGCYRNGTIEETKKTDGVATTYRGYLAPEQKEKGVMSTKSDVLSFGIILLETISRILDTTSEKGHPRSPEEWITRMQEYDWRLVIDESQMTVAMRCLIAGMAGLMCCIHDPAVRPSMAQFIEGLAELQEQDTRKEVISCTSDSADNANSRAPCTPGLNGLTESASVERATVQSGSSIVNKASISSVSKSVNEMQLKEVSGTPSQLEHVISVPKGSGEASSDDIRSLGTSKTGQLIEVYPQELRFPFEGNKEIQCPVTLTNRTDHHVGVWITQTSPKDIKFNCPSSEIILEPHSTLVVFVTLESKKQKPLQSKGKFQVLMIVLSSKEHLRDLKPLNMDSDFWEKVENLQCEVHRGMLTAVICDPTRDHIIVTRSTDSLRPSITSMDVHPIKTWILMSHEEGHISIWNYQTKERLTIMRVNNKPGFLKSIKHKVYDEAFKDTVPHGVYSVKFISRKKWLAAGDGYGYVHIYAYTDDDSPVMTRVEKFKACSGNSIDSLAIHPSMPYLLSSSVFHNKIELWNWDKDWSRIQEFDVKTTGVRHLTFNPRDTNTFACITYEKNAMVWNIQSSSPTTTLLGLYDADYTHQHHFLVNLGLASHSQTKEKVQSLCVSGYSPARRVACHPTLPLLATTLDDGHICLWDANTYRLEKMIHITDNSSKDDLVFTGSNGFTRLVAKSESMITAIEVAGQWRGLANGLVVGADQDDMRMR